jgi:hypothetical protein
MESFHSFERNERVVKYKWNPGMPSMACDKSKRKGREREK